MKSTSEVEVNGTFFVGGVLICATKQGLGIDGNILVGNQMIDSGTAISVM